MLLADHVQDWVHLLSIAGYVVGGVVGLVVVSGLINWGILGLIDIADDERRGVRDIDGDYVIPPVLLVLGAYLALCLLAYFLPLLFGQ